ncbi:MAG: BglG family transcription antiterminator [Enterococcus sp.]
MRQERLLFLLEKSQPHVLPSTELIDALAVSERTLINDIKSLKEIGGSNGFFIHRVRGKGYRLMIENEKKYAQYKESFSEESYTDTPALRLELLKLDLLLQKEEYVTLQELSEQLYVSKTTIKKEINKTKNFFASYHLSLKSKAHYGYFISGDEGHKRQAILSILKTNGSLYTERYAAFEEHFKEAELRVFLGDLLQSKNFKVNDVVFENLIVHIKLLYYRVKQKRMLEIKQEQNDIEPVFLEMAKDIFNFLKGSTFPDNEKAYLAIQLQGKINNLLDDASYRTLKKRIVETLSILDHSYRTSFVTDSELIDSLILHIAPLKQRILNGNQLENPIIDDIYSRYAPIFNLTLAFNALLFEDTSEQLDKSEIGYLTVYFAASLEKQADLLKCMFKKIAVICGTGGGTSYLLKVQLERIFQQATIKSFALNEVAKIDSAFDLIISTVPLDVEVKIPIIYVSQLLTQQELARIEREVTLFDRECTDLADTAKQIKRLFRPEAFRVIEQRNASYFSILEEESRYIEKMEWAGTGFSKSVLERENLIDTIYLGGVAGPHPMKASAIEELIDVVVFPNGIIHNGKEVSLLFLINIRSNHLALHQEISRLLLRIMEDDVLKRRKQLINYIDLENYLSELMRG